MTNQSPGEAPVKAIEPSTRDDGASAPPSIVSFLTDGSLSRICRDLSLLTGARATLRDPRGHIIHATAGEPPWVMDAEPSALRDTELEIPIWAGGAALGSIAIDATTLDRLTRETFRNIMQDLAAAAGEICDHVIELEHRLKEIGVLYRLSSKLARATHMDELLHLALDSALDVLELDAGSIVLLSPDGAELGAARVLEEFEDDVVLKASRGLSVDWLSNPLPLSRDREFDRLSLSGEVVTVENLLEDPRTLYLQQVEEEGLRSFISAGLVFHNQPIGVMRLYSREVRSFTKVERRLLKSIAYQAAVSVEQARLLRLQEEERRMQRQIELAGDVQQRMLPVSLPSLPGIDIAAKYVPSQELGGDFYDVIGHENSIGIVVGDVVGKGIAAALLMSHVRSALRAYEHDGFSVEAVMERVNRALCRDTLESEFATLWYGSIDAETLELQYCSAGHDPTFVFRPGPDGVKAHALSTGDLLAGIIEDTVYKRRSYTLQKGDCLVAYTDGVTDIIDFERQRFRRERLQETVAHFLDEHPAADARSVVDYIFWSLRQFAGLMAAPDDQTVVVVRIQ